MKKIVFAFTMICVLAFLTVPVLAGSPETYDSVVVGKSDPAYDVKVVQDAVDKGGVVLLKGTFDFGTDGRVNIKNDVKILGKTDNQGKPLTKIKGGFWTFHSPLPSQLPPEVPGPKITIQGIHFDGALWAPILLAYSSGATITSNKITNVRPKVIDEPIFGKSGLNRQQGIVCSSSYVQPKKTRKYQPGSLTGLLTIADNDIDMANEAPTKTLAQGVMVLWTTGVTAQILRNTVLNVSRNSIETLENFLGQDGSGMIVIKDNKIVTPTVGIPVPTPATPDGIVAGWFLDITGGADPVRNSKIIIMDNYIEARGDTSIGIILLSNGGVVASNNIVMKCGPKAIGVFQAGSDGFIANNDIKGSGLCAILVRPLKALKGSRNTIALNKLSSFKSSMANVILKGDNNVVAGDCGKVVSAGKNNQILGKKK